jgi:hypothetical protein
MSNTAPTVSQIDKLGREYKELERLSSNLKEEIDRKREEILKLVKAFGTMPARAGKSKSLEGTLYELVASFGQNVEINPARVSMLKQLLKDLGYAWLFERLFDEQPKYRLLSDVEELIGPKSGCPASARRLYSRCFAIKAKTPSVSVREKKTKAAAQKLRSRSRSAKLSAAGSRSRHARKEVA